MVKQSIKYRIIKHGLFLNFVFLLLVLCIFSSSFADEQDDEFPWEIFYPGFIKESIDEDKDGFTKEQGDCNDSDPSINPNANEICGDGIDQDCDGIDLTCPPCFNIAGDWNASETVTITCCLGGDCETNTFSGTDIITIYQNECNISYNLYLSGFGDFSRTGTIDANNIQLSGIFAVLQPQCTATKNNIIVNGTVNGDQINLQGSGKINGTCYGMGFSCTGGSTAILSRLGSPPTSRSMINNEPNIESATPSLLNNCIKIFSIIGF